MTRSVIRRVTICCARVGRVGKSALAAPANKPRKMAGALVLIFFVFQLVQRLGLREVSNLKMFRIADRRDKDAAGLDHDLRFRGSGNLSDEHCLRSR